MYYVLAVRAGDSLTQILAYPYNMDLSPPGSSCATGEHAVQPRYIQAGMGRCCSLGKCEHVWQCTAKPSQVSVRCVCPTFSFVHCLTEYNGFHGPQRLRDHRAERQSALIHHLMESLPTNRHSP